VLWGVILDLRPGVPWEEELEEAAMPLYLRGIRTGLGIKARIRGLTGISSAHPRHHFHPRSGIFVVASVSYLKLEWLGVLLLRFGGVDPVPIRHVVNIYSVSFVCPACAFLRRHIP